MMVVLAVVMAKGLQRVAFHMDECDHSVYHNTNHRHYMFMLDFE